MSSARELAIDAGIALPAGANPRVYHVNLFRGGGYGIATATGKFTVWGGYPWMPDGAREDPQLRQAYDEACALDRDSDLFNEKQDTYIARVQELVERRENRYDFPQSCKQQAKMQWDALCLRKGDIIIAKNSHWNKKKPNGGKPTKYVLGVVDTEGPESISWDSCKSLGAPWSEFVQSTQAGARRARKTVHEVKRVFRHVIWVREGDWASLTPNEGGAHSYIMGMQSRTLSLPFGEAPFLELLANCRPYDSLADGMVVEQEEAVEQEEEAEEEEEEETLEVERVVEYRTSTRLSRKRKKDEQPTAAGSAVAPVASTAAASSAAAGSAAAGSAAAASSMALIATDNEVHDCAVCHDGENTHVIIPCGHRCLCGTCANKYKRGKNNVNGVFRFCPMCRSTNDGQETEWTAILELPRGFRVHNV